MTKHTPGPWLQFDDGGCTKLGTCYGPAYASRVWGPAGPGHGLVADCKQFADEQQNIANAKLVAAAPDLLAALELLLPVAQAFEKQASKGTSGRRGGAVFAKARAAINRAKGEQS